MMFKKWFIAVISVLLMLSVFLAGCSSNNDAADETTPSEQQSGNETGNEQQASNGTAQEMQLFHDKLGAPSYQKPFEAMAEQAKNDIGLTWKTVGYADTSMHQSAVKTALPTPSAPEMFTWWSDYRMEELYKSGNLLDLTDVWEKHADEYDPALKAAFDFDGKVYAVPLAFDYWSVWYNKPLFDKYDLKPPKTWDEFIALCDTIKSKGVTPLGITVQGRWPTFIWFEEIMTRLDPDAYENLMVGKINYDDPTVKKTFDIWKDMLEKGYFTDPGTDMFADIPRMMQQEKVAMQLVGDWYTDTMDNAGLKAGQDYDTFILPPIDPKVGNVIIYEASPILFSKNAKGAEDAKKLADWWMSPETNEKWSEMMGFIPTNKKVSADFLTAPKNNLVNEVQNGQYRLVNRYWEATPTEICENAVDEFARFILNPDQEDSVIANLSKMAKTYWDSNK